MMPGMDPFLPDDAKLAAIRALLPSTGSGIRLDASVSGPFPAETDRALQEADDWELRVGRSDPDRVEDAAQRAQEARSVIAAVLSASPSRVVLGAGATTVVLAILSTVRTVGRILVVGEVRAPLLASIRSIADVFRTQVSQLAAVGDLVEPSFRSSTAPVPTLVVVAHVDPVTGATVDVSSCTGWARATGALVLLDAAWSVGAVPVDGPGTGADIVLLDGHRWLLGPDGVTAAWLSDRIDVAGVTSLLDPLPRSVLLGLARSVGWLLMYVGLPWAFERGERLAGRLHRALADVPGVELLAPESNTATTIPFRIGGWPVDEAATELARRCFAVLDVDEPRDLLRASAGWWLREDEIDRFVTAVGDLARHTPETLPRRPMLTLLGDDGLESRGR